jgi:hypothetical protein
MVEPAVLTLQVSPRNTASDQIVRDMGNNPKILMRLMNSEPVSKLSEYLVKKWKLGDSNPCLSLYSRGSRMLAEDPLSAYMENSVSVKLPLEFDLVPMADEALTVSSTPVSSPAPSPTPSADASSSCFLTSSSEPAIILEKAALVPIPSERKRSNLTERKERKASFVHEPTVTAIANPSLENSRVEQIYKEMMDREKDIFMSILDSQARWLSQVQSQMVSTCLAVQEKALRLVMGREEDDSPRAEKRQKRHK